MSMMCSKSVGRCLGQVRRTWALNDSLSILSIHYQKPLGAKSYHLAACKAGNLLDTNHINVTKVTKRNIFGASFLGISKLEQLRENRAELYKTGKDRYIERLAGYLEAGDTKSIITEDLINLIALADTDEHLDLLEKIATKSSLNSETSWGSAVMRLYYKMNKIDRAVNNIKDEERFGAFFQQRTSYQIAMTMLYDAGRYQEVVDLYESSVGRFNSDTPTDRTLSLLVFASYAKMNTPESFEKAQELYKKDPNNSRFLMRVTTLLSYLAVNQNAPNIALNLLAESPGKNHISIRELRTIALIKLNRFEDVVFHLRRTLAAVERGMNLTLQETFDLIQSHKGQIEDERIQNELTEILADLKQTKLVGEETLESIIFKPLERDNLRFQQDQQGPRFTNFRRDTREFRPPGAGNASWESRSYRDENRPRQRRRDDRQFDEGFDRPRFDERRFSDRQDGSRRPSNRRAKSYFEEDNIDDNIDEMNQRFK